MPLEDYRARHADWSETVKAFDASVATALTGLIDEKTIEPHFFPSLVKARNIEKVFEILCAEPNTGISYIHTSRCDHIRHTFSDKVDYNHAIDSPFLYQEFGENRMLQTHNVFNAFPSSASERQHYAKQIIEHAFLGLKDSDERLALAELLLSDTGKLTLLSIAELKD